ncbi:response regulator [Aquimarina spongiae]|uniref:Response regulator receiver domain-containing protein n=1 Tax=Aquimarina spongiae TaxID=570521 RepID=A0A1M6C9E7_9FLAO|nr:response regulator [Aquimarina spongiae]SHI57513.1 Response regulator receiver domain-containing protein [Aquimarina spongiae]
MNILYVEDNKINAMVMDKMLSKHNSNVIIAENGSEALKLVREKNLDLILVDINLGLNQMDGCELLQRFKRLEILNNIPVFAVTAYAMPGDEQRFLRLGFDNYFSKPVNFEKLISAISTLAIN